MALTPELAVSDISVSLPFYLGVLGFTVKYDRPEEGFAYLSYFGAELMLDRDPDMIGVEKPFGRGLNIEINTEELDAICARLDTVNHPYKRENRTYRTDEGHVTQEQIWLNDPDGYLLRFSEVLSIA